MSDKNTKRIPVANNVLAEGEVTGHSHRALGEGVSVYRRGEGGTMMMEAPNGAEVVHEEHDAVKVPSGFAGEVRIVQERDHLAEVTRQVVD